MHQTPISFAIGLVGGQEALADYLGITQGLVSQWVNGKRPIAAHHCRCIESATDAKVTRYMLRPDVFGPAPDTGAE